MLLQRVLYGSWARQIITSPSLHHVTTLPLRPRYKGTFHILLRSYRSSRQQHNVLQTSPIENLVTNGYIPPNNVVKAIVFTGTFTVGCFAGATILEYENTRNMMMQKARQAKYAWLKRKQSMEQLGYFETVKYDLEKLWDQLTPGEKVFAPICMLNLVVFGLWRLPALRQTMLTYFCSNPAGRIVCWPMFLSTFSHYSALHIAANMYVLHSFSNVAVNSLGKEQFLALYLSGGVIASMGSIIYKALTATPGLSLGASGCIMTLLAYVCTQYPDTQLSVLFLPMFTFSASTAIKVIIGLDFAGCVLGWKFFDHAAHLAGAFYGVIWAYFGAELWQKRVPLLTAYHDWRKTK